MRKLRLTAYFLIGFLLSAVSVLSFAGNTVGVPDNQFIAGKWNSSNGSYATAFATQFDFCNYFQYPSKPVSAVATSLTSFNCFDKNGNGYQSGDLKCPTGYSSDAATGQCKSNTKTCPLNSTNVGGTCTCNAGLRASTDGKSCYSPACTAGKDVPGTIYSPYGTSNGPGKPWSVDPSAVLPGIRGSCSGGCAVDAGPGSAMAPDSCYAASGDPVGGVIECGSTGLVESGSVCSQPTDNDAPSKPATKTDTAKPATTCGAGEKSYEVNGVTKCYTPSGQGVPTPADNATIDTTNQVTLNADGSKTVTTTTTNTATGQSSTTVTVYPSGSTVPDGLPSSTSSPVIPGQGTGGTAGSGGLGGGTSSGNGEGDKDLCEDDPDRLACQKLGEVPAGEDLTTDEKEVQFTEASGFGFGSYSCPQDSLVTLHSTGQTIKAWDWQPSCTFAEGIKPVVLAAAFIAAAMIGIGGRKD